MLVLFFFLSFQYFPLVDVIFNDTWNGTGSLAETWYGTPGVAVRHIAKCNWTSNQIIKNTIKKDEMDVQKNDLTSTRFLLVQTDPW